MLTKSQQLLLLEFLQPKTKKEQSVYKSYAFYKIITFLKRNSLIVSKKNDNNSNIYSLTKKGIILARIIAGLNKSPEKYSEYKITDEVSNIILLYKSGEQAMIEDL